MPRCYHGSCGLQKIAPRVVRLARARGRVPVTELLFWFLVSQTLTGLPAMTLGTEVRVVSPDLLTIYATGRVVEDALVFGSALPANADVLVLVFPPDASESELAEALAGATALRARVDGTGEDLLVAASENEGYFSFRMWLERERGLDLTILDAARD